VFWGRAPVHLAQALSYLKATQLGLALVINFNVPVLLRGVRRSRPLWPSISLPLASLASWRFLSHRVSVSIGASPGG
jgi:PD-(D/E)XK nuclease superfamily